MGHTIRRPALRVNITRQARDALEYLQEQGFTANAAVSQALIEKARESWEHEHQEEQ